MQALTDLLVASIPFVILGSVAYAVSSHEALAKRFLDWRDAHPVWSVPAVVLMVVGLMVVACVQAPWWIAEHAIEMAFRREGPR